MRLVIPHPVPLLPQHIAELEEMVDLTIAAASSTGQNDLSPMMCEADAIAGYYLHIDQSVIEQLPKLTVIFALSVGVDGIDLAATSRAGIPVVNCPRHNYVAVAEHAMGLMLAVTRRTVMANIALRQGAWRRTSYEGPELRGKTLGLIGYGNIGKTVARYAKCFGMRVQWANSKTSLEEVDGLVASADVLCLCVPLTPATRHIVDARRIGLMKPGSYLVNTSRGAVVDQDALVSGLKEGRLAGAGLDVFECEPFADGIDGKTQELLSLDGVVATPHIAADTPEVMERLGAEFIQNLRAYLSGSPINVVN